jgi:MarR family transcriptional regulator, organic hydroperoxide resistance regulator
MSAKDKLVAGIIDDIRRVFQVVNEQSKKAKRQTGLTGPQLWTIKTIGELSPVKVSDLAYRMYLHPATVVGILNRLELLGLVKRLRTNEDRRVVTVSLTSDGNAILAKAPKIAQGLLVVGLESLPLIRLKLMATSLKDLVKILGAQELPPQLILSTEINLQKRSKANAAKRIMNKLP